MTRSKLLSSLPNFITIGRLFLVPIIIELIDERHWSEVFAIFLVAGVSDAVDGFLAKRFDLRTELGAYLDPLADKVLLVSIYVALAIAGVVPNWLAILVVSRDVMIVGAVLVAVALSRALTIQPLRISKVNTTVQIAFAACVLGAKAFDLDLGLWFQVFMVMAAALTVASAAAYLAEWLDHMGK